VGRCVHHVAFVVVVQTLFLVNFLLGGLLLRRVAHLLRLRLARLLHHLNLLFHFHCVTLGNGIGHTRPAHHVDWLGDLPALLIPNLLGLPALGLHCMEGHFLRLVLALLPEGVLAVVGHNFVLETGIENEII